MYYRKTKLSSLEIGAEFLHENTLFSLIYNEHAIMVGLTKDQFKHNGKDGRQVMTFPDDQEVMIQVLNPTENE